MRNLNSELQASTKLISILSESKEQLEKNLLDMDGVFLIINEKFEVLEANKHFEDIYEKSFFRENLFEAIEKEFHEETKIQLKKVIANGGVASFEIRLKNKKLYLFKVSSFDVIRKEEGSILKISGIDITELRDLESQIVDVLRTINLGVIFIDSNNKIMPGYSDYSKIIFEKDELLGLDIHDVLFNAYLNKFNDSEKDTLNSLRDVFGKDEIFFKVISFTLPQKIEIKSEYKDGGKKVLQVTLEPITIDGIVLKYMIIIQDITDISNTKKLTFSDDIYAFSQSIEKTPQDLEDCMRDLDSLVTRIPEQLDENVTDEAKGVLHSIKGLLSMNGLKYMAKLVHDIETFIRPDNYPKFKESLNENHRNFNESVKKLISLNNILSSSQSTNTNSGFASQLSQKISKFPDEVKNSYLLSLNHILSEISLINSTTLKNTVESLVDSNGMRFEILTDLDVILDDCMIEAECFQTLKTSLIHMVNNSYSHGFIAGSEDNKIFINAKDEDEFYTVIYKDSGIGVNISKMREVLIQSGEDAIQVNDLSEQRVAECIFKSGISTKDEVTDISGRGVGLSGVYIDILRIGGELRLDEFKTGCQFTLKVPKMLKREKEEIFVGADILTHVFDLIFSVSEDEKIKVPKGLYHIKDIAMFYKGLKDIKALNPKCLKISKSKHIKNDEDFKQINEILSLNDFSISKLDQDTLVLHLVDQINEKNFGIHRSLFSCDKAVKKAVKKCSDVYGINLEIIGEDQSDQSLVVFNYLNNDIYPSVLRFLENKIYIAKKGSV